MKNHGGTHSYTSVSYMHPIRKFRGGPQKEHSEKFDSIWLLVSRLSAVDILIYDENPGHLSDQNNIHGHLDQMSLKLHIAEFCFSCGKHFPMQCFSRQN